MEEQIRKPERDIEELKEQMRQFQTGDPAPIHPRFIQPEFHAPTGDDELYQVGPTQSTKDDTFENFTSGE
ncbi:hypothetical protein [Effusibacillus lacus]|uniref:Uncharacterized protein n=1 Tax=Effusibacillus lacus TaxID=1348429 RepID=A0A292YIT9_9BACL|nr:hypothetical protein [Effusibacillus lacus]TCS68591.1 hypothetical protein EDD64_14132 [Effusibacillus lacus]GAX88821.1 hypothetical protein EFBL_0435 [Effusibacillus lacus]